MSAGKPLPIRFSDTERKKLEEAAALAGYQYVSAYVRDKSLGLIDKQDTLEAWAGKQELAGRLAAIEQGLVVQQVTLAAILYLVKRKSSAGDVNELHAALEHAIQIRASDVMAEIEPQLATLFTKLSEDY